MNADQRVEVVAAELARRFPAWPPLPEVDKRAIAASVAAAPPMSDRQARRVGRLLFARRREEVPA